MAGPVSKILEQLRGEEERLEKDLSLAKEKVESCKGELKRVRGGISALGGRPNGQTAKPAPTKKCVDEAIVTVLTKGSPTAKEALKGAVEKVVVAGGFSRAGFALRFEEALAAPQFHETESGYALAAEPANQKGKTEQK